MKFKNYFFAIACLGFLVTSCSPQSIDEDTTPDNIKATTEMRKDEVIIPRNG